MLIQLGSPNIETSKSANIEDIGKPSQFQIVGRINNPVKRPKIV